MSGKDLVTLVYEIRFEKGSKFGPHEELERAGSWRTGRSLSLP